MSISDHLQDLLERNHDELKRISDYLEGKGEKELGQVTVSRLLACRLILFALGGQAELFKELFNRTEGKVADKLEVGTRQVHLHFNAPPTNLQALPVAQMSLPTGAESVEPEREVGSSQ